MRIAIIGSGISGLVAAYRLHELHDITLLEANDYVGGHTNTIDVQLDGEQHSIDTGFIVFNDWTYPNFISLLDELHVQSHPTSMSFSVRCDRTDLEYNGSTLTGLFAQRRNLVRPAFYGMLRDIFRFNRESLAVLSSHDDDTTIDEYLTGKRYSREFINQYLFPMGSAIWSCPPEKFSRFPIRFIVEFYRNHGLLSVGRRPTWRVIRGGSRTYVEAMTRNFRQRIRLGSPVHSVRRFTNGVEVSSGRGRVERFDHVIFACHSDQALRMIADPTHAELELLGAFPYEPNVAILHTDASVLPRRRQAWAAWNYHIGGSDSGKATVTYNMNILQGLRSKHVFCVTLNGEDRIDPKCVIRRMLYHHPVYTTRRAAAQRRHRELIGNNRSSFCGAYWGNGFHEDGVNSAMAVCHQLSQRGAGSACTAESMKDAFDIGAFAPVRHDFQYRLFLMYLDLSELDEVFQGRWFWSTNRTAWARYRRDDHWGDPAVSLDVAIRDLVEARMGKRPVGPIRLLTQLRQFGYAMNPASFFYCFDATGRFVESVVAEVTNTPWGEQHCYVLPGSDLASGVLRCRHDKEFHVSPFMGMDLQYRWRLGIPGERLTVHIDNIERGCKLFDATLLLERREITGGRLARLLVQYPLLTGRVFAAIYWQALRLWLRKCPFFPHPRHRLQQELTTS